MKTAHVYFFQEYNQETGQDERKARVTVVGSSHAAFYFPVYSSKDRFLSWLQPQLRRWTGEACNIEETDEGGDPVRSLTFGERQDAMFARHAAAVAANPGRPHVKLHRLAEADLKRKPRKAKP